MTPEQQFEWTYAYTLTKADRTRKEEAIELAKFLETRTPKRGDFSPEVSSAFQTLLIPVGSDAEMIRMAYRQLSHVRRADDHFMDALNDALDTLTNAGLT